MAPEVIEMSGGSDPKSDVWSVACVVVELITGSPPYFDLQPMPALFAIVRDESPPLPPGISPELRGFLSACFRKDPAQRPTASELRSHEWLKGVATAGAATGSSSGPARRTEHLTLDDPRPDSAASSLAGSGRSSPAHSRPTSRGAQRRGSRGDGGDGAWEPPASIADPQPRERRRRRPPPSSPFQDVKVAMNGDADADADEVADEVAAPAAVSVRLEYPNTLNTLNTGFDGDVARATRDARWSDLAGLVRAAVADGVTAAAVDAALTSADTAGALAAALHAAASKDGDDATAVRERGDVNDANAAASLDAAAAVLAATRRKRADGGDAPGETLAAFVTFGAASSTLSLLRSDDASVGVGVKIAAAKVVRELSRGGVVALRCLASCDAPRALAGVLAQSAMSPSRRELARVCVDVARFLTTLHTRAVTGSIPPSEASRMASAASSGGISSGDVDFEEDDGETRGGGVIFDAFARAGLIPALVNAIRDLNAAANEERGVGPGRKATNDTEKSESEKSESPSSVYRERVADILLDATRSRNDRGCAASRFALCELQAMHGLLALAGSPLPKSTSAKLLRVVGHLAGTITARTPCSARERCPSWFDSCSGRIRRRGRRRCGLCIICAAVARRRWSKPPSPGSRRISSPSRLPTCSTSSASRTNSARRRVPTAGARTGRGAGRAPRRRSSDSPRWRRRFCATWRRAREGRGRARSTRRPRRVPLHSPQQAERVVSTRFTTRRGARGGRVDEGRAVEGGGEARRAGCNRRVGIRRSTLGGFRRLTPRFSTRSGRSRASRRGCAPRSRPGVRWRRWWRRSALRRPRRRR